MNEILAEYFALFTQWWFWLGVVIISVVFWILFVKRTYITIDGKLCVRHGKLGECIALEQHLKENHPKEWQEIQKHIGDK